MEKIFNWILDNWDKIVSLVDRFAAILIEHIN